MWTLLHVDLRRWSSLLRLASVWNLQNSYLPWYCCLAWQGNASASFSAQRLLDSVRKLPVVSASTVVEPPPFTLQPLSLAQDCDIYNNEKTAYRSTVVTGHHFGSQKIVTMWKQAGSHWSDLHASPQPCRVPWGLPRATHFSTAVAVHLLTYAPGAFTFFLGAQGGFAFADHSKFLCGRCSKNCKVLVLYCPRVC